MLRFILWRILGLVAALAGAGLLAWFLGGGPGRLLRGAPGVHAEALAPAALARRLWFLIGGVWRFAPWWGLAPLRWVAVMLAVATLFVAVARMASRRRRRYVRLRVEPYRGDHGDADALVRMFEALHKRLLRRWWRRLLAGQPSLALEVHYGDGPRATEAWLGVSVPEGLEDAVETALRAGYPSCRLRPAEPRMVVAPAVLRLKKHDESILRVRALDRFEHERDPPVNRLLTTMAACERPTLVQLALTPALASFEGLARRAFKHREARLSRERREHALLRDRSMLEDARLRGALEMQHRALFFTDLRVVAAKRATCERIAAELRVDSGENRLVERGTTFRQALLGLYTPRVRRGEGNPLPSFRKGVFATSELASLWQLPSPDYLNVPVERSGLPLAPAPPGIHRPQTGGLLRDAVGAVSIDVALRKQNTAVPGAVEQGKSSFLVASVFEDLQRDRCAVIVLDPKGDAADGALSVVPPGRTCTLLDFAHPTCGFNPLAVDAPADVIADYVVAALKNLFTDADIRASSDRYLRNAIIAVLAHDRSGDLWDAARLLSVGEEGYAYRRAVGSHVRTLPEYREISQFFTAELSAQLADARGTTTAKLDAPVNKLARLLNSPSIKRVLLNTSLTVDFDRVIGGCEVLVVKGALGALGAGNTSVLMQMLLGMLDAALARQQDLVPERRRVSVALKIDEAPLVINRGFAETMALKRSAGLETVACWQTDAQWTDRDVREQLDALFAHRVLFATSSVRDARSSVALTMAEFSDTVRPGIPRLSSLGAPGARLHLPKHHAVASWCTSAGRQSAFVAETIPMTVDPGRLAAHAAAQHARGARHLADLRQPHWDTREPVAQPERSPSVLPAAAGRPAAAATPLRTDSDEVAETIAPSVPTESFRELVELDRAHRVRYLDPVSTRKSEPDPVDVEILSTIAALGHVLSSQLHRRFNPGRAASTTQRRLKRLSDAGLVARMQFHRADGGGVPMCYSISTRGRAVVSEEPPGALAANERGGARDRSRRRGDPALRQARHELHVAGWALALIAALGADRSRVRGAEQSVLHPPRRSAPGSGPGSAPFGPEHLRLPGGRVPHDFLRTEDGGGRVEVDRFESLRPDAVIEIAAEGGMGVDLMVERDARLASGRAVTKLEGYEHFIAGWSVHTERYGRRPRATPLVVFICRDRPQARACARAADLLLRACRAYAGEYPLDWDYRARRQIVFVAERDVHEGRLIAFGVPPLPPSVRVKLTGADAQAGEAAAVRRALLVPSAEPDT